MGGHFDNEVYTILGRKITRSKLGIIILSGYATIGLGIAMKNRGKPPQFPVFESPEEKEFAMRYVEHQLKEEHKPKLAREPFKHPV